MPTPVTIQAVKLEDVPKPGLSALQKVVEAPPVVKQRVVTPLPKPTEVRREEVKVKMSDIMKLTESKPVKSTKKKPQPVLELKQETPVKLIKGEIIYE